MPSLLADTLRALAAPKRLVPIVVVAGPLVGAQLALTPGLHAALIALGMVAAFLALAPFSWRALVHAEAPPGPQALRVLLFGASGLAVVVVTGVALPWCVGLEPSLMTAESNLPVILGLYWVGGWGLGRDIELELGYERERDRADALALEAETARLMALRSHFDPHFLFNTLNAIAEWTRTDAAVAEAAILRLAAMLRSVLDGVKTARWPLARELDLVEDLFTLYGARDPELFRFSIAGRDAAVDAEVPPLLLLPLAENAMTHGPAAGHHGEVQLAVEPLGDRVGIRISNPGAFGGAREGGEGLAMVERRLHLAYPGGRARFEIGTDDAGRTQALVELPMAQG